MKIQIDATVVAHQFAITDSQNYLVGESENDYSIEEVVDMIESESGDEPMYPNLYNYYTGKYDYYFEVLTNHAL